MILLYFDGKLESKFAGPWEALRKAPIVNVHYFAHLHIHFV